MSREVVIASAARTPVGSFQGALASVRSPELGAVAIKAAIARAGIRPEDVDEVIMGCVLPAGLGQAPARQAAIYAGIPRSAHALTVNKVCGSGLKSVALAAQAIRCGDADIIVAGGIENMSQTPYYSMNGRSGFRMGNVQLIDGMVNDGLWDIYNNYHMGSAAELCAAEYNITREEQDDFAIESYTRAQKSVAEGVFKAEITPVEIVGRKGNVTLVDEDEEPGKGRLDKIKSLRSAFMRNGTVTAGNASSINDGAAALIVMSADKAKEMGVQPLAKFVSDTTFSQDPEWFTTAPAGAVKKLLDKVNLTTSDVDLWELNEAFAVVSIVNNRLLNLDPAVVNIRGGAVAIGHPIGASGARILVTLLYAMAHENKNRGIASLCNGGGEAVAIMVER